MFTIHMSLRRKYCELLHYVLPQACVALSLWHRKSGRFTSEGSNITNKRLCIAEISESIWPGYTNDQQKRRPKIKSGLTGSAIFNCPRGRVINQLCLLRKDGKKNLTRWCWLDWFQESTQRAKSIDLQSHIHTCMQDSPCWFEPRSKWWRDESQICTSPIRCWQIGRRSGMYPPIEDCSKKNQRIRHDYKRAEVTATHSRICSDKRSKHSLTSFIRYGGTDVSLNVAKAFKDGRRVEHNRCLKMYRKPFRC